MNDEWMNVIAVLVLAILTHHIIIIIIAITIIVVVIIIISMITYIACAVAGPLKEAKVEIKDGRAGNWLPHLSADGVKDFFHVHLLLSDGRASSS